ncbi:MAG: GWxTD domain-containing protein [Acidobacteriota bacterium]
MSKYRLIFCAFFCLALASPLAAGTGDLASSFRQQTSKSEEKADYYRKWLEEDVVYIIAPEEKEVFQRLTSDDEKEVFIEQFWKRRDPDPGTAVNEFKEEHYRRIAYANDFFTSGVPGYRTDRGRIYITYGPPNDRERRPSGGSYQRTPEEGGGSARVYPFERWYYRHINGVGENIYLTFVDKGLSGKYELVKSPAEKEALLLTPDADPTTLEQLGLYSRAQRLDDIALGRAGSGLFTDKLSSLRNIKQYFDLLKNPPIQYKDLQQVVETRVTYHNFAFLVDTQQSVLGEDSIVAVSLEFPSGDLTFRPGPGGQLLSAVRVYGRVQTIQREVVQEFEDEVFVSPPGGGKTSASVYQKKMLLAPGRYKLTLVLQELNSGKIGVCDLAIDVSKPGDGHLSMSDLVLAQQIAPVHEDSSLTEPFVTPLGLKVYPNFGHPYPVKGILPLYSEIYGAATDQASRSSQLEVVVQVRRGEEIVYESLLPAQELHHLPDRSIFIKGIDLAGLQAGSYRAVVEVVDAITGQRAQRARGFTIADQPRSRQ